MEKFLGRLEVLEVEASPLSNSTDSDYFVKINNEAYGTMSRNLFKKLFYRREVCPACACPDFSVARDMKSTRHCPCGHQWLEGKQGL